MGTHYFSQRENQLGGGVKGIAAGGDDYLTKPVNPPVLSAKLQATGRISTMRAQLLQTTTQLEQANAELKS